MFSKMVRKISFCLASNVFPYLTHTSRILTITKILIILIVEIISRIDEGGNLGMIEWETQGELDLALLRQMEREALLETVYDERRLSDAEIQTLLKERSVRALAEIRRILDEDTLDETCFEKIERVIKVYEAIGADGGARHDF